MLDGELREKLRKIEALFAGAATPGERQAAGAAAAPNHPSEKVMNAFRRRGAWPYATEGRKIWRQRNLERLAGQRFT